MHTLTKNSFIIQLELTQDLLQDLSSTLDTSSSGEESSDEEGEKQQGTDEEEQAEQAKLQEYTSRFQVGVIQWVYVQDKPSNVCWYQFKKKKSCSIYTLFKKQ